MGREDYRDSGIADVSYLRNILEWLKSTPKGFDREQFFTHALLGYYDAMWSGMRCEVGDIIFRISDILSIEERKSIAVYPSKDGSILLQEGDINLGYWDSLEDWRGKWVYQRPEGIPTLTELWPESSRFLPLFQNPNR